MANSRTVIRLYYDVISPYTWIAFEVLCRYRAKWNIILELKPFFLSGIMQATGNQPPGFVPAKANYMKFDIERLSNYFHIPINQPSDPAKVMFEKGSLQVQRFLTAAKQLCPDHLEGLSRQLWIRIWSKDEDIVSPESLAQVCKNVGLKKDIAEELMASVHDQKIKEKLKEVTEEAVGFGAFGSPFIVAEVNGKKEGFFGSDRFELLAHIIGEKWLGPLVELKAKY